MAVGLQSINILRGSLSALGKTNPLFLFAHYYSSVALEKILCQYWRGTDLLNSQEISDIFWIVVP